MGGAHSHSHADVEHVEHVETAALPRLLLLGGLALAAVATVIGLVVLWPDGEQPKELFAAPGVTFPEAEVVAVGDPCPVIEFDPAAPPEEMPELPAHCNELKVELDSGDVVTVHPPPDALDDVLQVGDAVKLIRIPAQEGQPVHHEYVGPVRNLPIGLMTALFVLVVAVVGRLRGLLALVGLVFAGLVIAKFVLPALLDGGSGVGIAVTGSAAIMFVVLYLAHGPSVRTSAALAGTLVGVGITAVLGVYAVNAARLSGMGDESGEFLRTYARDLDFQGMLTCAIIIAGLGILNDVTITQSSSVWELRSAGPELSRRELFTSGMRIGRDHIASTIYTIVFAYAGAALATLLLISVFDRGVLDLLTDEALGEEIMRTLASGIGLVLAMPATTAIAVLTVKGAQSSGR